MDECFFVFSNLKDVRNINFTGFDFLSGKHRWEKLNEMETIFTLFDKIENAFSYMSKYGDQL